MIANTTIYKIIVFAIIFRCNMGISEEQMLVQRFSTFGLTIVLYTISTTRVYMAEINSALIHHKCVSI